MRVRADLVLRNIGQLLTMDGSGDAGIGLVSDAVVCVKNGKVLWAGPAGELDSHVSFSDSTEFVSAGGGVVTPGFVDSHTHPIFGATRQEEFAMRAAGADYREIAAAGKIKLPARNRGRTMIFIFTPLMLKFKLILSGSAQNDVSILKRKLNRHSGSNFQDMLLPPTPYAVD